MVTMTNRRERTSFDRSTFAASAITELLVNKIAVLVVPSQSAVSRAAIVKASGYIIR